MNFTFYHAALPIAAQNTLTCEPEQAIVLPR